MRAKLGGMACFTYHCPMRWADMDPFGHVNNALFVVYLEQARVELFFRHAHDHGVDSFERGVVIARHEIDYLRPVVYAAEPLRIDLWVGAMGGAWFNVDYEVYDRSTGDDLLAVRASSKCVPYDLVTGRPRRLTAKERTFLDRFDGKPATTGAA